jgi:hypothetical protein
MVEERDINPIKKCSESDEDSYSSNPYMHRNRLPACTQEKINQYIERTSYGKTDLNANISLSS